MAYKRTNLAKLIHQKTHLTLNEFCEQHLKSDYKTFQMRMRKRKFYPAEVVYICWILGVRINDIFGYSFQDLVMYQGKYEVPEKVRETWTTADKHEKNRLLALLGLNESDITPMAPKAIPKYNAPKVKADQKAKETTVDFFVDIDPVKEAVEVPKITRAPEGPKNDGLQELFIETY